MAHVTVAAGPRHAPREDGQGHAGEEAELPRPSPPSVSGTELFLR